MLQHSQQSTNLSIQKDSRAWVFFVKLSFIISLSVTSVGIALLPLDFWMKGYLAIGLYFTISSTFTLSKTLRDDHEASKYLHKLSEAKAEKLFSDYELNTQ